MNDDMKRARNQRRGRRRAAARHMATLPANRDWVKDRRRREEYAVLTTLSLYRKQELATTDVGVLSGVSRPRRALRRLERLGLAKSIKGWHKDRYQALRGWKLVARAAA